MFKGIFDVLHVDVVIREVNDFTIFFILCGAIDARDGLNGVDAFDLFIKKEGVQSSVIEACLQFCHHNNEAILGDGKLLQHFLFRLSFI